MFESEKIFVDNQKEYLFGQGILFFLAKHSRLDIINITKELPKANDYASPAAHKKLLHMIKYALETQKFSV